MKEQLDRKSRKELIEYRMSRALESLSDADFCASGGRYILAVNRLYYACFYMASALMNAYSLECASHKGVKTMLNLHFVVTGKLNREIGKTFSILFESRQTGDYEDFAFCDESDYEYLRPKAETFIESVAQLIQDSEIYEQRAQ
ncbi:MAG: HEPN domain-containing protein [Muribaculum sp.]|nr:HEPN domain-containing protein [Muribaculum sp.]